MLAPALNLNNSVVPNMMEFRVGASESVIRSTPWAMVHHGGGMGGLGLVLGWCWRADATPPLVGGVYFDFRLAFFRWVTPSHFPVQPQFQLQLKLQH